METSASPAGFARFDNQNGGQVEMGNAAPISIIETGVSFKDLRRDSKENDDSTDKQGKIRLQVVHLQIFFVVVICWLCCLLKPLCDIKLWLKTVSDCKKRLRFLIEIISTCLSHLKSQYTVFYLEFEYKR